ncbi:hypothetical protein [Pseudomonas luteola]|uniref:hypothetical protein n=1 Tax=Pseudomonas luteola TaxID=47886 RepID=UPI00289BAFB6|nr:hypothetical protein [Pseudomonas luteola]
MIKLHLDICTRRRLSGWAFDEGTLSFPEDLFVVNDSKTRAVRVKPLERPDVCSALNLKTNFVGFDVVIPDLFDEWVADFFLFYKKEILFSYTQALTSFKKLGRLKATSSKNDTSYLQGFHVCFLYENNSEIEDFFLKRETPLGKAIFPEKIGGCNFSSIKIEELPERKEEFVRNLDRIVLVCPEELLQVLARVSPTLLSKVKKIILFERDSLKSDLGLDAYTLNYFVNKKIPDLFGDSSLFDSFLKIWMCFEQYQDVVFLVNDNTYFISSIKGEGKSVKTKFLREHVQGICDEDVVKISSSDGSLYAVNISAYTRIFDFIGKDEIWRESMRRGLSSKVYNI